MPQPPRLSTSNRRQSTGVTTTGGDGGDEAKAFRARPMPDYNATNHGTVAAVKPRGLTVPTSPRISKTNRRQPSVAAASGAADGAGNSDDAALPTFRARPMPNYNAASHSNVAPVKARELTIPTSPRISKTNRRQAGVGAGVDDENDASAANFQARPMPDYNSMNSAMKGRSSVKPRALTVPKPPALSVTNRNAPKPLSSEEAQVAELQHQFRARPAPSGRLGGGHAGIGMVHRRPITEPEPFSFPGETYHEQAQGRIEDLRRRKEEEETQSRQFVAAPMPNLETGPAFVTKHSDKALTEFKEFDMRESDLFHAKKREWAERKATQDFHEAQEQREFHARPLPESTFVPAMVPKPSDREPVVPDDVEAYDPPRAAERRAYDELNKQRIEKEAAIREALVREREEQAEEEYRELMRTPITHGGLRFTARGMPTTTHGSPDFVPHPSDAPLTEPYTPEVLKRPTTRSMSRAGAGGGLGGGAMRVATVI